MQRKYLTLFVVVGWVCSSGAQCTPHFRPAATNQAPVAFYGTPTLQQVVEVINANTSRVQQLQSYDAKLSIAGLPALQTNIALERPQRFRLQAQTGLTGTELDLGSNDELFWFWAKRNEPAAVYYARHQEFGGGVANQVLPLPPQWLISALGLIDLNPNDQISGPFPREPNRLEIRVVEPGVSGVLTRVIVIDNQRGHVLEQHVYDQSGQLLATAISSNHEYDTSTGTSLPRHVDIQLPPAQISFSLDIKGYNINQLYADASQLWSMPRLDGHPYVDLMRLPR
ncbi:MAG: hypothetical protein KDA60_02425 [Planctomycetales bacterium]|nr:hypothetical protein [Planctomycetales bacterium]